MIRSVSVILKTNSNTNSIRIRKSQSIDTTLISTGYVSRLAWKIQNVLKVTLPLPKGTLPLQNKLEYLKRYFNLHTLHPFYVVLIVVLHPFLMLYYKTNTTQHVPKREVFYKTN